MISEKFYLTKKFHIFQFLILFNLFFVAAEPHIGKGFLIHAETMKKVYTEYCINHDKAEQLLEKYEQIPEVFLITSDAIKIEPKAVVKHYCVWFDFYCIRRY